MVTSHFSSTHKSELETLADLAGVFTLMGIGRDDWSAKPLEGTNGYEVKFWLPFDRESHRIINYAQKDRAQNLRTIYMHIEQLQRDAVRGVLAWHGAQQYIRELPSASPGTPPGAAGAPRIPRPSRADSPFKNLEAACAALGVRADAEKEIVDVAARHLMAKYHTDRGNKPEEFIRVQAAKEMVYRSRGWVDNAPSPPLD
ncbi:MAG: hypothetical protein Q8P59_09990 [Dehalococcoidia bacterium]|nr:hypothetical protein [Dehalococcoidia bacterium]